MTKNNFCPFDGKTMNLHNLAYEIVHPEGWSWEKVKKEINIGYEKRNYISENNEKRYRFLLQSGQQSSPQHTAQTMLLANPQEAGKDGLTLLRESLEKTDSRDKKDGDLHILGESYQSYEDFLRSVYRVAPIQHKDTGKAEKLEEFEQEDKGCKKIKYKFQNSLHSFVDMDENPIMYALPCCPYCHNRLPIGWLDADTFWGILIVGEEENSITIPGDSRIVSQLSKQLEGSAFVYSAYYEDQVKEIGNPGFFQIKFQEGNQTKSGIVGIYQYSLNTIQNLNLMNRPWMKTILDKIDLDICFINQTPQEGKECQKVDMSDCFQKCEMLSLKEQAEFQRLHAGERISAKDLLEVTMHYTINQNEILNHLEKFSLLSHKRIEYGYVEKLQDMGVLIASQWLEENTVPEIQKYYGKGYQINALKPEEAFEYENFIGLLKQCIQWKLAKQIEKKG